MNIKFLSVSAAVAAVSLVHAQGVQVGPRVGAFLPQSAVVRDAFGSAIPDFGFGRTRTGVSRGGSLRNDINVINANRNGNRLFLVPANLMLEVPLTMDENADGLQPYVRVGGGVAYMDYALTVNGNRVAAKTFGLTGSAELGVVFAKRWNLFGRYNYFQQRSGIDFSGITVGLSFSIVQF